MIPANFVPNWLAKEDAMTKDGRNSYLERLMATGKQLAAIDAHSQKLRLSVWEIKSRGNTIGKTMDSPGGAAAGLTGDSKGTNLAQFNSGFGDDDKKSSDKKSDNTGGSGKAKQEGDPNAIGMEQVLAMLKKQAETKDKDPAVDDDDTDDEVVASTDTETTTTTTTTGDDDDTVANADTETTTTDDADAAADDDETVASADTDTETTTTDGDGDTGDDTETETA